MYFGRKHGGHSVREEMKTCVSPWSLPALQHTHVGWPEKRDLQMERRRHWRVPCVASRRVDGCCSYLSPCLAAERGVLLCAPGAEGMGQKTAPGPFLFVRVDVEMVHGARTGFGHWSCSTK